MQGHKMRHQNFRRFNLAILFPFLWLLTSCGSDTAPLPPTIEWPIAKDVYTTAERQILPVGLSPDTPKLNPAQVALYDQYGYGLWLVGNGTNYSADPDRTQAYDRRLELAPDNAGASNAACLLTFFAITDIHLTDKESPAQPIYPGWSAVFGPTSAGLFVSSYSPIILSTTHVLDAAIQTVNALHEKTPFDFGISLGDNINNNQYNELRWFIDVMDGEYITPSSGAHAGAGTIDYQKPYKAAGLNRAIPWYQVIGNHDQYWSGIAYESVKTRAAHVGNEVINIRFDLADPNFVEETGAYMGVVDGTTPYGDVIKCGPEENFAAPPTVVADKNRHALATDESSSLNWMTEFFTTTSNPVGHGFTQANLDQDFACYTFVPKADVPLKVIVLDDTNKKDPAYTSAMFVGSGALDQTRLDWLRDELQKGQDEGQLMIIAAHIPIRPQKNLDDETPAYCFYDHDFEDELLATLHEYPNLILWIAGHRHLNTVTAQPNNPDDPADQPERSFWEVETASLRDFPQQFRIFEILRNSDNTISILVTNVDPAVAEGSPAAKSRGYAIGAARIFGATPAILADTTSHAYNAELVKQLTPEMQAKIADCGTAIEP
ncbi:MAG: TIGR03768 family metallophosphoesterase [Phycisphaerae bacterium]|nr:TIGR03768 family metallophosphoesterase [Phycisphaerae bacterium]